MTFLADLFDPPYYAVIFCSVRTGDDAVAYGETAARMLDLARGSEGYLGVETLGDGEAGITVSYWQDEASIAAWRDNLDHAEARRSGRETWYRDYRLRVAKVERAYGLNSGQ